MLSLVRLLTGLGLRVNQLTNLTGVLDLSPDDPPDLAIVDTGGAGHDAVAQLHHLRKISGSALHITVLIPVEAEASVAQLMLAGAAILSFVMVAKNSVQFVPAQR